MGQKVNPIGFRLGVNKNWDSIWFSNKKDFLLNIKNDFLIRKFIKNYLLRIPISKIIIERVNKNLLIFIHTSRPGVIIGKKGEDLNLLSKKIYKISNINTKLNIIEIKKPEIDAKLVSENICYQISKNVSFRKSIKKSIKQILKYGALGVKIKISGRLGGAEIARRESYKEGRIPLHTIRADIDYNSSISKTKYGIIGVKVWIFKGEIF